MRGFQAIVITVALARPSNAFAPAVRPLPRPALQPQAAASVHSLRGGSAIVSSAALTIPAAFGISAVAGSLCYIRQAYIFSLSYGLSMLGIGGAVLLSAPQSTLLTVHAGLVAACMPLAGARNSNEQIQSARCASHPFGPFGPRVAADGLRLFGFLFWRQQFQPGYDGMAKLKALDKTPRAKRTPIILSTAIFYALLASPLLHHAQVAPLAGALAPRVAAAGNALAAVGLAYEAIADQQKSLFKMVRCAG